MKTSAILSVLTANDPQTIYDIFSGVRADALDMTTSLSSIGVALASLLAAFTLIKISSDIITGRGTTLWQIFRPFVIILLIANLGTLMKGVDGGLNFITMKIMKSARANENQMNAALTRASGLISEYRKNLNEFNDEAKLQANATKAIEDVKTQSENARKELDAAIERLNNGEGESINSSSYPGSGQRPFLTDAEKFIPINIPQFNDDFTPADKSTGSQTQSAEVSDFDTDVNEYNFHTNEMSVQNASIALSLSNRNKILDQININEQETIDRINSSLDGSKKRVKDKMNNIAREQRQKNGGDFSTGNTPWEGLMGYIAGDINPYCTTQEDIETSTGGFHGLSTIVNWLANKIYLILNTWAELTLILLAFLAPFIFAFSVLPFYKDGISSFFARYIQISFWKVCASAVTWASVVVRYSIMEDKITALNNLYEGSTDQLARITAYDFVTLFISIATLFTMFTIPKVASYIIESSGTGGAHDSAARKGAALAGKPGTLAGGAMRKKIFG